MMQQMQEILKEQGYRRLQGQYGPTEIFYQYVQGVCRTILLLDGTTVRPITVSELQRLKEQIRIMMKKTAAGSYGESALEDQVSVDILTILIGYDEQDVRILCANVENVWVYNKTSGKVVVYEDQPADFYGLITALEKNKKKLPFLSYIVTVIFIVINVLVFIHLAVNGNPEKASYMLSKGAMYPARIFQNGEYWRFITAAFLHFGMRHLVNNMFMLGYMGSWLEKAMGHIRFLILYLMSGIGGNLLSYLIMCKTGDYAVAAGASGAIFGVVGGTLWVVICHRGRYESLTTPGVLFMIAFSLYYGVATAGTDNWGHIGGLFTGILMGMLLYRRKRSDSNS